MITVTLETLRASVGHGARGRAASCFVERFWGKVEKRLPHECWLWSGTVSGRGYGRIWVGTKGKHEKLWLAHRLSFLIANGWLREDLEVCHSCDVPPCVNPLHLFQGTQQDNLNDAKRKNRIPNCEQHWNSQLDVSDVLAMRERHAEGGATVRDLSKEFGVHWNTARNVISGRTWKAVVRV